MPLVLFDGQYRYYGFVALFFLELNYAVDQGEQGVVFAHTYVQAWMVAGATLTH